MALTKSNTKRKKLIKCKVHVCIIKEQIGYTAFCANLPGVVTEGETVFSTLVHLDMALSCVINLYVNHNSGNRIPFCSFYVLPREYYKLFWMDVIVEC